MLRISDARTRAGLFHLKRDLEIPNLKPIASRPVAAAPRRSVEWSKERIAALGTTEIAQLRVNAERLNDPDIMGRCDEVLKERKTAARLAAKEVRNAAAAKAAAAAAKAAAKAAAAAEKAAEAKEGVQ